MIRTSSVNGSEEMKDEGLAMAIEIMVPMDWKEYRLMTIKLRARRDPDDPGSVRVAQYEVRTTDGTEWPLEPRWKVFIRRLFKIY